MRLLTITLMLFCACSTNEYKGAQLALTCTHEHGVEYVPATCTTNEDIIDAFDGGEWLLNDGRVCTLRVVER